MSSTEGPTTFVDDDSAAAPDPSGSGDDQRVFALPGGPDETLSAAVELARAAALEVGEDTVGEHLGVRAEGERLVTHAFVATLPGYTGWHWAVSLARASRSRTATVDEVVLLPGDGALLAPSWVPWNERVRPGDLSPGDLLPTTEDDSRLVPGYTDSGDPQVEAVAFELGIGRERVLSRDGRELAADRWYTGERGPDTPMARQAPAQCGTCGFFVSLAGSLAGGFGVCGNEVTDSDGRVVSVEYGCGAHSNTQTPVATLAVSTDVVWDDGDEISSAPRGGGADTEAAAPEAATSEPEAATSEPEVAVTEPAPAVSEPAPAVSEPEHVADPEL